MNPENNVTFKSILISQPNLSEIISPSIGMATEQKIHSILKSYAMPNHHLIGAFLNEILIGVAGIEIAVENGTIKHIAISDRYRKQKIGKNLIIYIAKQFSLKHIVAETDDDSVEFYKKCGFQCFSFIAQYGKRYRCDMEYGREMLKQNDTRDKSK